MELNWLYRRFGEDFGPVSLETLHELRQSGLLDDDDLVRDTRETDWRPAAKIPALEAASDFDMDVDSLLSRAETASANCIRRESEHRDTLLAFGRRSFVPGQREEEAQPVCNWYYRTLGHVMGPYTFEALQELAQGGTLERNDDVREGEEGVWLSAKRLPELFPKKLDSTSSVDLNAVEERAEWICRLDGDEQEPMKLSELQNLVSAGQIERKDMVRRAGGSAWIHAQDVNGLKFPVPASRAPAESPAAARSQKNSDPILDYLAPSKESAELAASNKRPTPAPTSAPASYTPPPAPSYTPSAPPAPAYTPQYRPPVAAPPPPATRSRSSSGPSWSFSLPSGLLDNLKDPKLLGGLGACIAVAVLVFGMRFLTGSPGSKEFATVQQMWTEIDEAMKTNAGDAAFKAMSDKHLTEVKTLRKQIEPRASAQNRLAQIVLYCTRDHLPKIYTGADADRKKQYERMKADMQEASELYQRANG